MGLVGDIEIRNAGLLQDLTDDITPGDAGKTDPRNPVLTSLIENHTDDLVTQYPAPTYHSLGTTPTVSMPSTLMTVSYTFLQRTSPPMTWRTSPPMVPLVLSSRVSVQSTSSLNVSEIRENTDNIKKGSDIIGITVDGMPLYSDVSKDTQVYGKIFDSK